MLPEIEVNQYISGKKNISYFRVMSYNVRMSPCKEDHNTENEWKHRWPKIKKIIDLYQPDILCLQEFSDLQAQTLVEDKEFVGYELRYKTPDFEPRQFGLGFLIKSERFSFTGQEKVIRLNESGTPQAPAWDGSHYDRYVYSQRISDQLENLTFYLVNTHFDHLGESCRLESARIWLKFLGSLPSPSIACGDFNCFPQLGGNKLYRLLSSGSSSVRDSYELAESSFGVKGSWIGWSYDPYYDPINGAKYDHIFVSSRWAVSQQGIIDDKVLDSSYGKYLYPSDHRPVIADLRLV